jgi:tripartite ATP-independent transporter DctP family solute receptor
MKTGIPMLGLALTVLLMLATACQAVLVPSNVKSRLLVFSLAGSEESSSFKGATRFADLVKQRTNGMLAISVFPRALLTSADQVKGPAVLQEDGVDAELAKPRTNGRLVVSAFSSPSLASGDPVKELEMLQKGQIDFTYSSTTIYSNLDQQFSVLTTPWMFSSYVDVDRILTGPQGQKVLTACDRLGIVGLALGENGFDQLTNSKLEIKTPADLKGLKIRIPSVKMYTSVFGALGATTTLLNPPEVYNALRDGRVDGQENSVDQVLSNKFYEVQKYMTIWNYSYAGLILGVNKDLWDSFDPGTREILRKAAEEASAYQVQESRKATDAQLQFLKNKGMTVTVLSPEQIRAFRDLVPSSYADYESVSESKFMTLVARENR